jgi:hypothetical protein
MDEWGIQYEKALVLSQRRIRIRDDTDRDNFRSADVFLKVAKRKNKKGSIPK